MIACIAAIQNSSSSTNKILFFEIYKNFLIEFKVAFGVLSSIKICGFIYIVDFLDFYSTAI